MTTAETMNNVTNEETVYLSLILSPAESRALKTAAVMSRVTVNDFIAKTLSGSPLVNSDVLNKALENHKGALAGQNDCLDVTITLPKTAIDHLSAKSRATGETFDQLAASLVMLTVRDEPQRHRVAGIAPKCH